MKGQFEGFEIIERYIGHYSATISACQENDSGSFEFILLVEASENTPFEIKKQWEHFELLHQALLKEVNKPLELPTLPTLSATVRTGIFSTQASTQEVAASLNSYLSSLLSSSACLQSRAFVVMSTMFSNVFAFLLCFSDRPSSLLRREK